MFSSNVLMQVEGVVVVKEIIPFDHFLILTCCMKYAPLSLIHSMHDLQIVNLIVPMSSLQARLFLLMALG